MTGGLLIKKDIVGQSLHRVSMPTMTPEKKKLNFMLLMLFSVIIGMLMFWSGFHNVDLAQHYYERGDKYAMELNGFGMSSTIDNMYMQGLDMMFTGFFIMFFGGFVFGILIRDMVKSL